MKEVTKTTVFEYDKDGNIIKKTEMIVEKEIHQGINPNFPYNPYSPVTCIITA